MNEELSALMDGELGDDAADRLTTELGKDQALQAAWHEYHLIGDAMRGLPSVVLDVRQQVSASLERESTVLAPRPARRARRPVARLALAASVALAGVVGWYNWQAQPLEPGLTAQAVPTPATAAQVTVAANPRQSYLDAHQDAGFADGLARASLVQATAEGVR